MLFRSHSSRCYRSESSGLRTLFHRYASSLLGCCRFGRYLFSRILWGSRLGFVGSFCLRLLLFARFVIVLFFFDFVEIGYLRVYKYISSAPPETAIIINNNSSLFPMLSLKLSFFSSSGRASISNPRVNKITAK